MTLDQLTDAVISQTREIAALSESTKSAHKRIDENDQIIKGIHKLAANVEALVLQVKLLTDKLNENSCKLEESIQRQGERIGALEKEPGNRWKTLVAQVISLLSAGIVGGIITRFGG